MTSNIIVSDFFAKNSLQWLAAQLFITILLTAITQKLTQRALINIHKRTNKTEIVYDAPLVDAMYKPVSFLIWIFGVSMSISLITDKAFQFPLANYIPEIQKISIVAAIAWLVLRFVARLETQYLKHAETKKKVVDITLTHAIAQLISISTLVTSALLCMQIVGLPITGLLAFGGIGGAAVAFAAKDLLANIFGSLVIYPFTKTINWVEFKSIQHKILINILNIIKNNGAECAFPTQTLWLQKETPPQSFAAS